MKSYILFTSLLFCILYQVSLAVAAGDCHRPQSAREIEAGHPLSLTEDDGDVTWDARFQIFRRCENMGRYPTRSFWSQAEVICSREERVIIEIPETYKGWRECVLRVEMQQQEMQRMRMMQAETKGRGDLQDLDMEEISKDDEFYRQREGAMTPEQRRLQATRQARARELVAMKIEENRRLDEELNNAGFLDEKEPLSEERRQQRKIDKVRKNLQNFDDVRPVGSPGIALGRPVYRGKQILKSLDDDSNRRHVEELEDRLYYKHRAQENAQWPYRGDGDAPDVDDTYRFRDFNRDEFEFGYSPPIQQRKPLDLRPYDSDYDGTDSSNEVVGNSRDSQDSDSQNSQQEDDGPVFLNQVIGNGRVRNDRIEEAEVPEIERITEVQRNKGERKRDKFFKLIGFNLGERKRDQLKDLVLGKNRKNKKKINNR